MRAGLLDDGLPLLDAAYEVGLSGPSRLHDLFVTHEAMSPGDFKTRGGGLIIRYGFHSSPFGKALVMTTERGICGLAFADDRWRRRGIDGYDAPLAATPPMSGTMRRSPARRPACSIRRAGAPGSRCALC